MESIGASCDRVCSRRIDCTSKRTERMRFEDLTAGQQLEFGSICVSESEIIDFANRYDPQPFHMDPAAARESRWGGIIPSGVHPCGLRVGLVAAHGPRGAASIG